MRKKISHYPCFKHTGKGEGLATEVLEQSVINAA
jgi:hypothetical protein